MFALSLGKESPYFSSKFNLLSMDPGGGGRVLNISLGGEVRPSPSYLDPV